MHIYTKIYEFAASAGALEGYVYRREGLDLDTLPKWVDNLVAAYQHLPADVREEFQASVDQTVGRAIQSLLSAAGERNETVRKLESMVAGPMPDSADDFRKKKWFEK